MAARDSASSSTAHHLTFIDGLRGVAILLVVLRHYYMAVYNDGLPRWFDALGLGYIGVHLFLVLSGFCVAWAYVGPKVRPFAAGDFFYRRATRILPAYYVALVIALLVSPPLSVREFVVEVVTHATMTHNFFDETVLALNGAFWSLALECQLYLTFPLFLWAIRRHRQIMVLAAVLVVQMIYRVIVARRVGTGYTQITMILPWALLGRFFEFGLGVWNAHLISSGKIERFRQAWLLPCVAALAFGGALLFKRRLGVSAPMTDLCFAVAFSTTILAASRARGLLNYLTSLRPIVFVGKISYSTYLMHSLFIEHICGTFRLRERGPVVSIAALLPVVLASIAGSYVFFWLVEKRAMDLFAQRRRVPAPDLAKS
jgi:peptidoglycan/LPS O-acetylase OafA/YrhL